MRDERVLERRRGGAHLVDRETGAASASRTARSPSPDVAHHHVEAIAEPLDVDDAVARRRAPRSRGAEIGGANLEPLEAEALAQLGRRADPVHAPLVHERDAMAALGLVEVRRGQRGS